MPEPTAAERAAARAQFRARVRAALKRADEAFRGQYADAITQLLGLSQTELAELCPAGTDIETYNRLIAVVKEASRVNIAQAELRQQIMQLGSVAVAIARRVPGLAFV